MGSSIPGLLEGTPVHNDGFLFGFGIVSGQSVSVGNVVKIGGAFQIEAVSAATDFPLGVAYTSGQLSVDVGVAMRGILDVIVDNTTTAGDYLVASTTSGEMHDNSTTAPSYGARAIALSSGSASGVVQALFL